MTHWRMVYMALALFLVPALGTASPTDDAAEAHYEQSKGYNKQRAFKKSRLELTRAIELRLETHKFHQALFINYVSTRQGLQGIKFYEDLTQANPNSPTAHYWLGRFYLQRQTLEEAAHEFEKATQLAPKDDHAFIALGHANWRLGDDEAALKAFTQADRIAPKVASVHAGLGNVYYKRKQFAKAQREYEIAIDLNTIMPEARFNLGLIHEKNGEIVKAVKLFKEILDADPNVIGAREQLAQIYIRAEQYKDSAQEYSMISRLRPLSADVFMSLGESLILWAATVKDPSHIVEIRASAVKAFQQTLEIDPENTKAKDYLKTLNAPVP